MVVAAVRAADLTGVVNPPRFDLSHQPCWKVHDQRFEFDHSEFIGEDKGCRDDVTIHDD
jgi:hypothetical protein